MDTLAITGLIILGAIVLAISHSIWDWSNKFNQHKEFKQKN